MSLPTHCAVAVAMQAVAPAASAGALTDGVTGIVGDWGYLAPEVKASGSVPSTTQMLLCYVVLFTCKCAPLLHSMQVPCALRPSPHAGGPDAGRHSTRTDVYALGLVLLQLATGAAAPQGLVQQCTAALAGLSALQARPPGMRSCLHGCQDMAQACDLAVAHRRDAPAGQAHAFSIHNVNASH